MDRALLPWGCAPLLAVTLACSGGGPRDPGDHDTGTSGTATESMGTGSITAGTQVPDACESTEECMLAGGGFCVAPYDAGGPGMGPAVCVPACVAENDLRRWCVDHEACCEGLLCRAVDGFCEAPDATGTGTSTSTGTSG